MLPSRSRLEGWNPDSLTYRGSAVGAAGTAVEHAVDRINRHVAVLPEVKAWESPAHDAANAMFRRAHDSAAGGAGGAALGGVIPIPGAAPVMAVGAGYAAGEWMKSIGTKVGTALCGT